MEDKYYTPEIEAFHVGFECEEWIDSHPEGFWSECNIVMTNELLAEIFSFSGHYFKSKFRVKYLSKEDIESLGFKLISVSSRINFVYSKPYIHRGDSCELAVIHNIINKWTVIIIKRQSKNNTIFCGFLKNKGEFISQLKRNNVI